MLVLPLRMLAAQQLEGLQVALLAALSAALLLLLLSSSMRMEAAEAAVGEEVLQRRWSVFAVPPERL